ncbi:hypothetical protein F3Y22_tig00000738pilonHSYRG00155 [Hibiscus syriacus]|uniref:Uncharacterized protein n=1 Tax=Hibiscus syriacus TaxID=106335 RepID=A0A6A3CZD3_HIBSY|nr:hypothetical protein F3Y22_tig00000738pilonHSYRG00155 [Hibiscus syriacus]
MASENKLLGDTFLMVDGAALVTEVLTDSERTERCLSSIYQNMIKHQDMVVGLDIIWVGSYEDNPLPVICTRVVCVLITLQTGGRFYIKQFLDKQSFRNLVDLGALALDVLQQPRLRAVGVRRLASEVLSLPFESRSLSMTPVGLINPWSLNRDKIEGVATDAYV